MLLFLIISLLLNYFYVSSGNFIISLVAWPLIVVIAMSTWGPAWGILSVSFIVVVSSALPFLGSIGIVDRITR